MGNKAQASLEYLITYGWALILIAVVVSVLVFIVSTPASEVTFSSSDPAKILVRGSAVNGSTVEIILQNITGGEIQITVLSPEGYSSCTVNGYSAPLSVPAGGQISLECDAPADGRGTITLEYTNFAGLQRSVAINASGTSGSTGGEALQLFENYTTDNDYVTAVYHIHWAAQTFTPAATHKIASVKLKLCRGFFPGTITVGIRATDGSGKPTGSDLCNGTIDGDALISCAGGTEWKEIILASECTLAAGTKYSIVARAPSSGTMNLARWWFNANGTYANGTMQISDNSGASWYTYPDYDLVFEEWGLPA